MDFCRNIPITAPLQTESNLGSLDDLFSGHPTEGDVNLEWLSIFVEDCLSSSGNCLPPQILPPIPQKITTETIITTNPKHQTQTLTLTQTEIPKSKIHKFLIPSKARTKRKRNPLSITKNPSRSWSSEFEKFKPNGKSFQISNSDPPLLQQTYWLADSELILPKNGEMMRKERIEMEGEDDNDDAEERLNVENQLQIQQQTRRCSHCLSQRTPQWRAGPLGPKTLCNACGVRYKSGRLLPEYRPAKSPTFVSYKHSNSHKKVLEMRMSSSSSST